MVTIKTQPVPRGRIFFLFFSDSFVFILTWFLCGSLFKFPHGNVEFLQISFLSLFFLQLYFWNKGHYTRKKPLVDEMGEIFSGVIFVAMANATVLYSLKIAFSRYFFFLFFLGTVLGLIFVRCVVAKFIISQRWKIPTVIIGTGSNAQDAALALMGEPQMGIEIKAFLEVEDDKQWQQSGIEVLGKMIPVRPIGQDPVETLLSMGRPNLVVALELGGFQRNINIINKIQRNFVNFHFCPALRGLPLYGLETSHFFRQEVLMLRVRNNLGRRLPKLFKRTFDLLLSLVLLIALSPLFLFLFIKLKAEGGEVVFSHSRIGQKGAEFPCHKFRTMVRDADKVLQNLLDSDPSARKEWDANFKLKNDPRITPLGKFLRSTSLDELPQLWNVLKGEMSLVGPRPIIQEEVARYSQDIKYYYQVKPGMTGLWQISGRSDSGYGSRVWLDVWYVKNWSPWYDLVILFRTLGVVFRGSGAY